MLSLSVFLLATSALVGAAVLPRNDVDRPTSLGRNVEIVYPRDEGVVPEQVVPIVSHQSGGRNVPVQPVQNVFLRQQQPVRNVEVVRVQPVQLQQPVQQQYQVRPAVPGTRGAVLYGQVSVVPKGVVAEQGVVRPQPPAEVQPKHQALGHDVVADGPAATQLASARILKQQVDVSPDGSFVNDWNSDNGISVHEQAVLKRVGDVDVAVQTGEVSYVDNEGRTVSLRYVADENGFHVEGDHLPTPPPVPEAIARGLRYIEEHPYVETTASPREQYQQGQPGQQYQPGQQGQQQYQPIQPSGLQGQAGQPGVSDN